MYICVAGTFRNFETSAMLPTFGVWTLRVGSVVAFALAGVSSVFTTAASTLAAYEHESHATIASSPESTRTWNSALVSPPIAPESAATMR